MTTATAPHQVPCPRPYCGGQLKAKPETGELCCLLCSRTYRIENGIVRQVVAPEALLHGWSGHQPRTH